MMKTSSIDTTILYSGAIAAFVTILIVLSQIDGVARYILSPLRLRAKRRQEQLYRIEKTIAKSILYIRRYINNGNFYEWAEEKKITDLVTSYEGLQNLVEEIVANTRQTPLIVGISKDLTLAKVDEWYIHLAFPIKSSKEDEDGSDDYTLRQYGRRVQVPLEKFGRILASKFEKESPNFDFCFIADASSSLGSQVVGEVIQHSKFGIPLIQEPAWIYTLAFLIQIKAVESEAMEKVLFALFHLSAQGVAHIVGSKYNTIAMTLPGQASTASLMSLMPQIFPSARYVLLYDDCDVSVMRSQKLCNSKKYDINSRKKDPKHVIPKNMIPETVMAHDLSSSIPIQLLQVKQLTIELASLRHNIAGTVEAWMSSINTFRQLEKYGNSNVKSHTLDVNLILDNILDENFRSVALRKLLDFIVGNLETLKSSTICQTEFDSALSIVVDAKDRLSNIIQLDSNMSDQEAQCISRCKGHCFV